MVLTYKTLTTKKLRVPVVYNPRQLVSADTADALPEDPYNHFAALAVV